MDRVPFLHRLWEEDGGISARLLGVVLTPAELGFRAAVRVRATAYRSGIARVDAPPLPTISIGNITVGGTGKTPMVRWTVNQLRNRGRVPGILHGGYADDEPSLHRHWFPDLPVVADRDRRQGAAEARGQGADILVMDDGFQHRALGRDLDVVLVAAETWTRYARLLPRGPFREPPRALRRADLVIITRRTAPKLEAARAEAEVARISGRPTARAHLRPAGWLDAGLAPRDTDTGPGDAVAVAGVAVPTAFFEQAEANGARLIDAVAFPDHHDYTRAEAHSLLEGAAGRPIATTAKDAMKLTALMPRADLWVLEQDVVFETGRARVLRALEEVLP